MTGPLLGEDRPHPAARAVEQSLFPDVAPDRPRGPLVGSVIGGTNADLIAAIAPLYLHGRSVLDVTYGLGGWWKRYKPEQFTCHDLDPTKGDGVDFRALPEADRSVDIVCFDPPYVISGSTASSTTKAFHDAYGIGTERVSSKRNNEGYSEFQAFIRDGLAECVRVAREFVFVKCMEFAQGPCVNRAVRFHDIPFLVTKWALELDCIKHDQIVHHTGPGPGGHNIFVPKRARRHHSYLLVFEVPS